MLLCETDNERERETQFKEKILLILKECLQDFVKDYNPFVRENVMECNFLHQLFVCLSVPEHGYLFIKK